MNELSNITNRGFLSGKELEEAIQNARFSVFPSECNENCPFSVMESITNGTPVIGASIGGVPELINDGQNGYLFESGNEEELCSKINRLWKDEKKLEILAEGCRNTVFYTLEGYCNKLLEYYM